MDLLGAPDVIPFLAMSSLTAVWIVVLSAPVAGDRPPGSHVAAAALIDRGAAVY